MPRIGPWTATAAAGAATALVSYAAGVALASTPSASGADAAETHYLARLGLLTLLALLPGAALAREPGSRFGWLAAVVGLPALLWLLPAGPLRGSAVTGLLAAASLLVVWPGRNAGLDSGRLAARWVPASLALQSLALSSQLLAFPVAPRVLVRWLGMPLVACALAAWLARRLGTAPAVAATLAAVAVAGRFSTAVVIALLLPAVAPSLLDSRLAAWRRALGAVVVLAPFLLHPTLGALSVLGALAFLGRRAWPAAAVAVVGLLALGPASRTWLEAAALLPVLLLVFPFPAVQLVKGALASNVDRGEAAWRLAAPLALAWIGARYGEPHVALAIPAVLLVIGPSSRRSATARDASGGRETLGWEIGWLGVWILGDVLAAGYPWLRPAGVAALAHSVRLDDPTWLPCVLAAGTIALLAAGLRGSETSSGPATRRWLPAAALALLLLVPLWRSSRSTPLLGWPAVELGAQSPSWTSAEIDPGSRPRAVVVDSAVAFGAEVADGTTLALLRWLPASGVDASGSELRKGLDTREWTATAGAPGEAGEAGAWLSLVGPDERSFVHRYRARRDLGRLPPGPGRLVVELAEGLPPELRLSLYRVALEDSLSGPGEAR